MDINGFRTAIIAGGLDDYLDEIKESVAARQKIRGIVVAAGVAIGDPVRLTDEVSPVAFRGLEGTVVRKNGKTVVVRLRVTDPLTRHKLRRYLGANDEVNLSPGLYELAR